MVCGYRAIFLWLCSKDLSRLTFNKVKNDSLEEILIKLRQGQATYSVVFYILCRSDVKTQLCSQYDRNKGTLRYEYKGLQEQASGLQSRISALIIPEIH